MLFVFDTKFSPSPKGGSKTETNNHSQTMCKSVLSHLKVIFVPEPPFRIPLKFLELNGFGPVASERPDKPIVEASVNITGLAAAA